MAAAELYEALKSHFEESLFNDPDIAAALAKEPQFASENAESDAAIFGRVIRLCFYAIFGQYADDTFVIESGSDVDLEVEGIRRELAWGTGQIKDGIGAYMRLQQLPLLRELQRATHRLDLPRLRAIDRRLSVLDDKDAAEAFPIIDEYLVNLFTAKKENQQLPSPRTIGDKLKKMIADFDCAVDFNEDKKQDREENPDKGIAQGECAVSFPSEPAGPGTAGMNLVTDTTSMALAKAHIDATAREHHISQDEAALKLLAGEITSSAKIVVYGYVPLDADGDVIRDASVFIPSFGWTDSVGAKVFHDLADENGRVVDLAEAATREVSGYVAPADVRAFCHARDGTCIYPGCNRSAWSCQLDHRIPYGDGGKTTASNLFSLCPRHHNMKTDRRATYIPDPVTGEIVWLFADGTYSRVDPNGFLHEQISPVKPRWQRSLTDWQRLRRAKSRFFALCHTILDDYEKDFDYHGCVERLEEVEAKYELKFPFHPVPPPRDPDPDYEPPLDPESTELTVQDMKEPLRLPLENEA